ncbi:unnamed protein product [Meloidogyne enterolobii]|uniref:Uncharacterized protein n=1 Tax=Meloidogyne enterolobii TaxID=390850 RepID=A0ACB0YEX1_MELEN
MNNNAGLSFINKAAPLHLQNIFIQFPIAVKYQRNSFITTYHFRQIFQKFFNPF